MDASSTDSMGDLSGLTSRSLSHARLYLTHDTPKVLFVHGGFHGAWCWSHTLKFLSARGIGAAAIDLRGHGRLAQSDDFIAQGFAQMAEDVVEALSTFAEPVFLVGHSIGALVSMAAARHMTLRGIILLAPAAPAGSDIRHALPAFPQDRAVPPPPEARIRKWFLSGGCSVDAQAYLQRLCPESPRLLNDCFHDGISLAPSDIGCPIFCLSGGKDDSPLHPAGQDQDIAARFGARLHIVAISGHSLMLDDGRGETAEAIHVMMRG